MIYDPKYTPYAMRTPKPFAAYEALMLGDENGNFNPDGLFTRGDAILAYGRIMAYEEDLRDTYTSDFPDLSPSDPLYTLAAFLERRGFLSAFGETLDLHRPITRRELATLLLEDEIPYETDGIEIPADLNEGDAAYTRLLYAVKAGILKVDDKNRLWPDGVLTRAEAARALCVYLGKKGKPNVTFADVNAKTPYAEEILLAASKLSPKRVHFSLTANGGRKISEYIEEIEKMAEKEPIQALLDLSRGDYRIDRPILLDGERFAHEVELTFKSHAAERALISSNVDIPGAAFKKVKGKPYYSYQLDEETKVKGSYPRFRNIQLNGKMMILARSPEYTFPKSLKDTDTSTYRYLYSNWFYAEPKYFKGLTPDTVRPMEVVIHVEWMNKRFRLDQFYGFEEDTGYAQFSVMEEEWNSFMYCDGNKRDYAGKVYWFENHLSLLSEPGQFFYDDKNGILYVYPFADTDMEKAVVSYPLTEKIFDLRNMNGVTIEDIHFTGLTSNYATDHGHNGGLGGTYLNGYYPIDPEIGQQGPVPHAAVYGENVRNVRVRNCTFDELGANGVFFNYGNRNVTVKGCSFTQLAMSAILVGRQLPYTFTLKTGQINVLIDNNYIYNIGVCYPCCPGMHFTRVFGAAVTHNTIIHTPYSAIMSGWFMDPKKEKNSRYLEIAYNRCEDNLYAINDGSCIYLCGANAPTDVSEVFSRIHHNFVKATGYNRTYNGIYLDANASNWLVYENVLDGFRVPMGPIFNQDHIPSQHTYNNTLRHNFSSLQAISTKATPDRNIQLIDNVFVRRSAEFPEEARAIIAASGQTAPYKKYVPIPENEIVLWTRDAHIVLPQGKTASVPFVTFTVTNHTEREATYRVLLTNDISASSEALIQPESLVLGKGETGVFEVFFRGVDEPKEDIVTVAEFDVVRDNGFRRSYRRVIDIKTAEYDPENTKLTDLYEVDVFH